jgi:hypothetical protein
MTFADLPSQSVAVSAFKFFQDQLTNRLRDCLSFVNFHIHLSSTFHQLNFSLASSNISVMISYRLLMLNLSWNSS